MDSILSNPEWGKRKTRKTSKGTKIVATKQVNIDIIAKDKTRQAMRSATGSVDRLKDSVFNLRNALLGLGAGVVAKSFIDTGRELD